MKSIDRNSGIEFGLEARVPAFEPNTNPLIEAKLLQMLGRTQSRYVSFGTEAGIFQLAGVPSVVMGPGDIADAHQPDESVEIAELVRCVSFLNSLVRAYC